jgi:hypothetical protein
MIYKFETYVIPSIMEVELTETDEIEKNYQVVLFAIKEQGFEDWHSIELNKDDIFKLIGALHLLHKEMI